VSGGARWRRLKHDARVWSRPREWAHRSYREIQEPPLRYSIIDLRINVTLRKYRIFSERAATG
jgi:hypothetical protein